ncbi:MAG: PPC domain-containing DNA-binding protein [Peptoniphilaceae bacterium]|nr:DNA-binding protein [Peptoniphilaceae bacterium]MDD7383095.1 DNA-binding protein [Peptoniphilaceae bacterium]MDY3737530.1 PPC domain-containing DNA-binding protein [Peptoniphilaceae bacterium]
MEYKRDGNKLLIRLKRGEEIIEKVSEILKKENVKAGYLTGLGACDDVTISFYDREKKEYKDINFKKPFEITMLYGNISQMNENLYTHFHITLADINANAFGGHLKRAVISMTAEIFVEIIDTKIDRFYDDETGINLMKFN